MSVTSSSFSGANALMQSSQGEADLLQAIGGLNGEQRIRLLVDSLDYVSSAFEDQVVRVDSQARLIEEQRVAIADLSGRIQNLTGTNLDLYRQNGQLNSRITGMEAQIVDLIRQVQELRETVQRTCDATDELLDEQERALFSQAYNKGIFNLSVGCVTAGGMAALTFGTFGLLTPFTATAFAIPSLGVGHLVFGNVEADLRQKQIAPRNREIREFQAHFGITNREDAGGHAMARREFILQLRTRNPPGRARMYWGDQADANVRTIRERHRDKTVTDIIRLFPLSR